MGILANYRKLGKLPPEIDTDSLKQNKEAMLDMVRQFIESGDRPVDIARYLKISRSSVYNYKKELNIDYIQSVASSSFVEIFGGELKAIEDRITRAKRIVNVLEGEVIEVIEDPLTGAPIERVRDAARIRDLKDANIVLSQLLKMKIDLELALSLKNKEGAPNIYGSIQDKNVIDAKEVKNLAKDEEVKELVDLLKIESPKLKNV